MRKTQREQFLHDETWFCWRYCSHVCFGVFVCPASHRYFLSPLLVLNVCLLPPPLPTTTTTPSLCPLSPCRAWLESAMRGSAGINLGNLISGALVPALNISISPGWPCWSWTCDGQQLGREEGEGERGRRVQRQDTCLTNRLVSHPVGVRWWRKKDMEHWRSKKKKLE